MPSNKEKNVRAMIFARDKHKCLKCGSTEELTIDHITPTSKGGQNVHNNYQTLCRLCNMEKGANIVDFRPYQTQVHGLVPKNKRKRCLSKQYRSKSYSSLIVSKEDSSDVVERSVATKPNTYTTDDNKTTTTD